MASTKKQNQKKNNGAKTKPKVNILTIFVCIFVGLAIVLGATLGIVSYAKNSRAAVKYKGTLMDSETASFFMSYYKYRYMGMLSSAGVDGVEDTPGFWNSTYEGEDKTYGELLYEGACEYIGQLVAACYLYDSYAKHREGSLTKMRQQLVCEKTLAKIAKRIGLGDYLNLGNGEEYSDCRSRPKILADALEALIAAVYLDSVAQGKESYKEVILSLFGDEIENSSKKRNDYKSMLQQLAEQDGAAILEYRVLFEQGPEHDKRFTVGAYINNNEVGRGRGRSKREAEQAAAKQALILFGEL